MLNLIVYAFLFTGDVTKDYFDSFEEQALTCSNYDKCHGSISDQSLAHQSVELPPHSPAGLSPCMRLAILYSSVESEWHDLQFSLNLHCEYFSRNTSICYQSNGCKTKQNYCKLS